LIASQVEVARSPSAVLKAYQRGGSSRKLRASRPLLSLEASIVSDATQVLGTGTAKG
jgi:hypothetical protein